MDLSWSTHFFTVMWTLTWYPVFYLQREWMRKEKRKLCLGYLPTMCRSSLSTPSLCKVQLECMDCRPFRNAILAPSQQQEWRFRLRAGAQPHLTET